MLNVASVLLDLTTPGTSQVSFPFPSEARLGPPDRDAFVGDITFETQPLVGVDRTQSVSDILLRAIVSVDRGGVRKRMQLHPAG